MACTIHANTGKLDETRTIGPGDPSLDCDLAKVPARVSAREAIGQLRMTATQDGQPPQNGDQHIGAPLCDARSVGMIRT
jgi:hypothetical protein